MTKFLQSKATVALTGTILFWLSVWWMLPVERIALLAPAESGPVDPGNLPWEQYNPEAVLLIQELLERKGSMDARQQQLDEYAARLEVERSEIDLVIRRLRRMQEEFDRNVLRVQEDEIPNLKKLARIYANMEPSAAVLILRELDDPALVKVLTFMKEGESAPILETLARRGESEARRAAQISETLRLSITRAAPATARPGY